MTKTGCGYCCGCCIIVIINVVTMIIGLVLAGVGGIMQWGIASILPLIKDIIPTLPGMQDPGEMIEKVMSMCQGLAIALLITGAIFFGISILGMCGACCKSKLLLVIYVILTTVLLLGQFILIIVYVADKPTFEKQAITFMNKTIVESYAGDNATNVESVIWNLLNMFVECCGIYNGSDFQYAAQWDRNIGITNLTYPMSCCKFESMSLKYPNCSTSQSEVNSNFKVGCFTKVNDLIAPYLLKAAGVVGGICGSQALIITISILLICLLSTSKVEPV